MIVNLDYTGKIRFKKKAIVRIIEQLNAETKLNTYLLKSYDRKRLINLYLLKDYYNLKEELLLELSTPIKKELIKELRLIKLNSIYERVSKLIFNFKGIDKKSDARKRQINTLLEKIIKELHKY